MHQRSGRAIMSKLCVAILAAVVLAATWRDVAAQPMPLTLFKDATSRNAVCNDGTPAGYYFRRGTTDRWLIFFEGTCAMLLEVWGRCLMPLTLGGIIRWVLVLERSDMRRALHIVH